MRFTTESNITLLSDVICRANQDGTVIVMKMNEDEYFYKINGVAAEIWLNFSEEKSVNLGKIADQLSAAYHVKTEIIINDAQDFLNKALDLKFIKAE